MRNKPIQKNANRQVKQNALPVIQPEQSIQHDVLPVVQPRHLLPIRIEDVINKLRPTTNYTQRSNRITLRPSVTEIPKPIHNMSYQNLLQKYILANVEIERLMQLNLNSKERRQSVDQGNQYKHKYEELLQRYNQGEQMFNSLRLKSEQVEAQYIRISQQLNNIHRKNNTNVTFGTSQNQLRTENQRLLNELKDKDNQIRSILPQLQALKQTVIKIKESQGQKKKASVELNASKFQEQDRKLSIDLNRLNEELGKYKTDNIKMIDQINYLRGEHKRLSEQVNKLKGQNMTIKRQAHFKVEAQNLLRQLQIQKQNAGHFSNQLHKIQLEAKQISMLRQKQRREYLDQVNRLTIEIEKNIKMHTVQIYKFNSQKDRLNNEIRNLNKLHAQELERERVKYQDAQQKYAHLDKQCTEKLNKYQLLEADYQNLSINKQKQIEYLRREIQICKSEQTYHNILIERSTEQVERLKKQLEVYGSASKENIYSFPKNGSIELQNANENTILKKHLQLSVKELKQVYDLTKQTNEELMRKVQQYEQEKSQIYSKYQYQEFELSKLYQVLKTRKEQIQTCYKTIENLRKGAVDSSGVREDLNEMLRIRREQLF